MSLVGRFALITGASSGIGRASAVMLAREGAQIAITGRNESALQDVMREIVALPGKKPEDVFYLVADISKEDEIENVVKRCAEVSLNKHIDILVNCAGVLKGGAIDASDLATWDYNMNVNGRAVFAFINKACHYMKRERNELSSSIINISSVNGLQSFGGVAAYCASKAAVDMITDCAAVDLARFNIRVNSINPGVIRTELQKRGGMNDDAYAAFIERSETVTHPLGRVGMPDEVANAVLFLADSSKSGFTSGTHLTVDGARRCLGAR